MDQTNHFEEGGAIASSTDLVSYQDHTIVSRTILKAPGGSMTLFAFDAGETLSEHTAPFDALVHVLDGEALITIGGKPSTVKAGKMILMPANIPHSVEAKERFRMALVMIRKGEDASCGCCD